MTETEIIQKYEPLAISIAQKYKPQSSPEFEDLLQIAKISLVMAHRNYDPDKAKEITHFTNSIHWGIKKYLRSNKSLLNMPKNTKVDIPKAVELSEEMIAEDIYQAIDDQNFVMDILNQLEEQEKTIFLLFYGENMSAKEISSRLKLKNDTEIYKILKQVRKKLNDMVN